MNDSFSSTIEQAQAWQATREAILQEESETGHLDHEAIQDSDDQAVSLADTLAGETALLRAVVNVEALHGSVWYDVGPKFTCDEANSLVALFEALSLNVAADQLREGHAIGDYEEDEHWTGTDPD
jgi:hypothetical protein